MENDPQTVLHVFIRFKRPIIRMYTIYETLDYTITRYKWNSVYDNTLMYMSDDPCTSIAGLFQKVFPRPHVCARPVLEPAHLPVRRDPLAEDQSHHRGSLLRHPRLQTPAGEAPADCGENEDHQQACSHCCHCFNAIRSIDEC